MTDAAVQWGPRLYLDCETTGFNPPGDEIVELSIVDDLKDVFSTRIRPKHRTSWPDAEKIHGISPADVTGAPSLDKSLLGQIRRIVSGRQVVIYNAAFDTHFFPPGFWTESDVRCCMLKFSEWNGERSWDGGWKWQKLETAATRVGHVWRGAAHGSLADCYATRDVWRFLENPVNWRNRP